MQVIGGQSEDSRKFRDTKTKSVALNAEVDGGIIAISTPPSSGTELSNQLSVSVLKHPKHVKDPRCLSFVDDYVEHYITLLLHIGPINIELRSDRILLILDDGEVPICLNVAPKPMIMQFGGPLIKVVIPIDHGLVFSSCIICSPSRVMTIHPP
jgi:hypothetical protein